LVILTQVENEGRFFKKCLSIHEILETDPQTSEILTQEIFSQLNSDEGFAFDLKKSLVLEKTRLRKGWSFEDLTREFNNRLEIVQKEKEEATN
jgi:hypothetical protein